MSESSLVFVGALHVDELVWPSEQLVLHASNPVRRRRRVGGVAANAARAAAAMQRKLHRNVQCGNAGQEQDCGTSVSIIAATGDDADAHWLTTTLDAAGVSTLTTPLEDYLSGHYTAVHDASGELLVGLSDTGIAERLTVAMMKPHLDTLVPEAIVIDANLSATCIDELLNTRLACESTGRARRIALAVSPAKVMRFATGLEHLDLLICNRREAAALSGMSADCSLSDLADALGKAGLTGLVLSDGGDPLIVQTGAGRHRIRVEPINEEDIASVNGAGDALAGASIAAWIATENLVAAVEQSGLPAARAIMRR